MSDVAATRRAVAELAGHRRRLLEAAGTEGTGLRPERGGDHPGLGENDPADALLLRVGPLTASEPSPIADLSGPFLTDLQPAADLPAAPTTDFDLR